MNLVIAIAILFSAAMGGTAYASKDAMPGDTLYGVKQTVETFRLAASPNDPALQLEIANTRLTETEKLLNAGRKDDAQTSLNNFTDAANKALDLLQHTNAAPSASVIKEVEKQKATIKVIEAQLPASAALEKTKSISREIEIEIEIEIKHEVQLQTPGATKVEDGSKTPEPKKTETPEVKKTEDNKITKTPEPQKTEKPEVKKTEDNKITKTPEPQKTEKPEVKKTETLEVKKTEVPEVKKTDTPEVKKIDAPEVKKTDAPEVKKTEKPEDKKPEDNK